MIELLTMALQLGKTAWEEAEKAGAVNSPAWAKWKAAGFDVATTALSAVAEYKATGTDKFDKMTPAQIRALLTSSPAWDEL